MNPALRSHLEEARRAHGVSFDVVRDWDALQDLARLADAMTGDDSQPPCRPAVEIGGVMFYRLSIGAGEWLSKVMPWFEGQDRLTLLCWAYSMAGSRNPVADLWPFADDRARLVAQLKKFAAHVGASAQELAEGLNRFAEEEIPRPLPGDNEEMGGESKASGFGPLVDLLLSEYGGTPEQWIWNTPRSEIMDLCKHIATRARAKAGDRRADPNDPKVIAGHRLVMRLREMVDARKAEANA